MANTTWTAWLFVGLVIAYGVGVGFLFAVRPNRDSWLSRGLPGIGTPLALIPIALFGAYAVDNWDAVRVFIAAGSLVSAALGWLVGREVRRRRAGRGSA